ncbi:hypothetical protein HNP33_003092 [Comamonas odontotermitis]|uniref:Uncharacterized protein n=1 Tax=Comamonas odontotermitis TaxID=379895 RepID=A0ABR6RIS0_9BURK|nr:hypothetical protein [Comamonas odontotermitis]MBB6578987.1 hypothetical protein [Comamonas odontotermitis]
MPKKMPWDIVNQRNSKLKSSSAASFPAFKVQIWENFVALEKGHGTRQHAEYVAQTIDVACDLAQQKRLGRDWRPELLRAYEAHKAMCLRLPDCGELKYTSEELEAVRVAMDIHMQQLDGCTAIDLKRSVDRLISRKKSGHFVKVEAAA